MANLRQLMVPFFCLLLLGSMVPFPIVTAEPTPQLIAGNLVYTEPDWSDFWSKFNKVSDWDLEWYDGAMWVSCKSDLQIVRDYPTPDKAKLTLIFDASHAGNYRLTFAINKAVKGYVSRVANHQYELNYENFTMVWDWSDALAIPGLVFTHGVQNNMFWFRMRRDGVPLGAHVVIDPTLFASYAAANQDDEFLLSDIHPSATEMSAAGQSFQNRGVNTNITSVKFLLRDTGGTANGNLIAALYAHSGTYGTNSKPTGAVLATSDPIAANTLGVGYALYEFTFTGAQQYNMIANAYYTIFVYRTGTTGVVRVGSDSSAPTATGNAFDYLAGWRSFSGEDTIFLVYGNSAPIIDGYTCTTLFTGLNEGWFNATVSEPDFVADLATVDIAVTLALNNTFTLRWTQATNTFSEVSDPDNVCTLNVGGSIRNNVDADTDEVCFLFQITGGTEGNCDVVVTSTDDYSLTDVETYAAAFVFSIFDWNPVADLINAAFALFGIADFMGQMTVYIGGLVTYFATSLANIVDLIVLQFQFITLAFGSIFYWFSETLGILLDFVQFVRDIMDGAGAYATSIGNLWDWIGWNSGVAQALPLFIFLSWIISIEDRSKTTPGGEIAVFINDFNTVANIISYFLGVFSFVANTIIDRVYGLIQGII